MKSRSFFFSISSTITAVLALAAMFAFMNTQPTQATTTVHYVAPGGVCGDRNPCYATVQSAVDVAETGDEIHPPKVSILKSIITLDWHSRWYIFPKL